MIDFLNYNNYNPVELVYLVKISMILFIYKEELGFWMYYLKERIRELIN